MIRELAKSIREYKKVSIMTPILVSMEVVMECLIPFIIANLVNQIKAGCEFQVIAVYGLVLVLMAGFLCCSAHGREIPALRPPAGWPKI